jgi:hypothetical protein
MVTRCSWLLLLVTLELRANNESWVHRSVEGYRTSSYASADERRCHGFTWRESVSDRLLGVAALNPMCAPPDIVDMAPLTLNIRITNETQTSKVREQFQ